jgi:hypothetical protein
MTADQRDLLAVMFPDGPTLSGDQTAEQAVNFAVHCFQQACEFEGLPVPGEAGVRAALTAGCMRGIVGQWVTCRRTFEWAPVTVRTDGEPTTDSERLARLLDAGRRDRADRQGEAGGSVAADRRMARRSVRVRRSSAAA